MLINVYNINSSSLSVAIIVFLYQILLHPTVFIYIAATQKLILVNKIYINNYKTLN